MRWRGDLRQSIADTNAIIKLSQNGAANRASITAIAKAKVAFFSGEKLACRFNREDTVCRVHGTAGTTTNPTKWKKRKRPRVDGVGRGEEYMSFSVPLPRTIEEGQIVPQDLEPHLGVSPRMKVVFSQLKTIATNAANRALIAEANEAASRREAHVPVN